MRQVPLVTLGAFFLAPAIADQVQLASTHSRLVDGNGVLFRNNEDLTDWSLGEPPNPNDTHHLVFETVHSLLQHWPNTRMRNGHNIVPGVIPKGTLLYHGTNLSELPPGPEWVATDPEHSYLFCRDRALDKKPEKECWHLTLTTTRPLKIIYFDGSSAANLPYGSMDTQDLIVWGKIGSADDEERRIYDLCDWGKDFGVDGFVRMELDFEAMLCDFTSGVRVVSFTNLQSRLSLPPMLSSAVAHGAVSAGSWHNHFPGETRVQLELAGLISFYDSELAPSLVAIRVNQERWNHRAGNISSKDLSAVKSRLETTLIAPSSSGIDWRTLFQVVVDRFAGRLELTRRLLNSSATNPSEIVDLAKKTQTQLRIMLTPYILLSAAPTNPSDQTDLEWTIPIYRFCSTAHTYSMEAELDAMTESEKLLFQSVRGTSREICRVVIGMWAAGVWAGIDASLNAKDSIDIAEVTRVWSVWARDLNQLMAWLDWSIWVKCKPECGFEELCYMPTWTFKLDQQERAYSPLLNPDRPRPGEEMSEAADDGSDSMNRPQPKCIRRTAPY